MKTGIKYQGENRFAAEPFIVVIYSVRMTHNQQVICIPLVLFSIPSITRDMYRTRRRSTIVQKQAKQPSECVFIFQWLPLFPKWSVFASHPTSWPHWQTLVAVTINPPFLLIHKQKGQTVSGWKHIALLSYSWVFMQDNTCPWGNFSRIITSRGILSCCRSFYCH